MVALSLVSSYNDFTYKFISQARPDDDRIALLIIILFVERNFQQV